MQECLVRRFVGQVGHVGQVGLYWCAAPLKLHQQLTNAYLRFSQLVAAASYSEVDVRSAPIPQTSFIDLCREYRLEFMLFSCYSMWDTVISTPPEGESRTFFNDERENLSGTLFCFAEIL